MSTLSRKTVLLTGATGTIGRAIARELSSEGAQVLLHYSQNRQSAENLATEIGNGALCFAADLSDKAAPSQLWTKAEEAAGEIHALINNAGILSKITVNDPLLEWQSSWEREMRINFYAAADLCRAAIRHFQKIGCGKIINMSSRAAQGGYRGEAMPYGASKAALINLTQSIAGSFGGDGITAVALAPGWVRTDMAEAHVANHGEDAVFSGIPIGKMAEPSEIAEIVSFLLRSTQMSLSGAVLDVNGASQMR